MMGGDFDASYEGAFAEGISAFGTNPFTASWQDIASGLGWGLGYFGMPHILVRFMAIEKPSMVKKSATVAIAWVVLSLGAAIAIAILGRTFLLSDGSSLAATLLPNNGQDIFISVTQNIFPSLIVGFLLAAIVAAAMSTADSQLLVASSAFTSDLYKPLVRKDKASDKELLWVGRIVVLVVSVIAFFIAVSGINGGSWASNIMAMVENAWGLFGSAFGPVVILSLFWRRLNYAGACTGIIVGAIVDIAWLLMFTNTIMDAAVYNIGVYEIIPGFIAGLIATVAVTLATKEPGEEVKAIYATATSKSIDD